MAEEQTTEVAGEPQFDPFAVPLSELREKILSAEPSAEPEPSVEEPETAPATAVAEPEPKVEASGTEPAPQEVSDVELLQAQMDLLQSEMKTSEAIAGKATGELGYLRKQNQELLQRLSGMVNGEDGSTPEPTEEPEPEPRRPASTRPKSDPALTWAVGQAASAAGQQFIAEYPDVFQRDKDGGVVLDPTTGKAAFEPEFARAIQFSAADTQRIMEANDPIYAAEETRRVLELAYLRADRTRKKARLEILAARRGVSTAQSIAKKKVSASASASPGEPARPRPLDPRKLPLDQLRKRILEGRYT